LSLTDKGYIGPQFRIDPRPKESVQNRWRKIEVEISPAHVRLHWENQHVQIPRQEIVERTEDLVKLVNDPVEGGSWYNPRAGLGLYIYRAAASFRSVVVEPLP
jgi:hypothetical protein